MGNVANPEIATETVTLPEDNLGVEEAELGIEIADDEQAEVTTEKSIETTEPPMEPGTTDKPMETTEVATTQSITTEETVTKKVESIATTAPQAAKVITTEFTVPESSQAPKRKFDDSRIIFSDEAIDNRNKVLATRVFIDDGLLPASTVKPVTRKSSSNDKICFPDQDLIG